MEDVARRAGVSRSLVSLVMRDNPHVSAERRTRVLTAAAELGYSPNAMARGLASRQSGMVAVLLNDLHNPFFAETFDGLVHAAEDRGYRLLLGAGSAQQRAELTSMHGFLEYRPDGIVLISPRLPSGAIAAVAARVPVVVIGRSVRADGIDCVMTDEAEGARLVIDHLAGLGHRRIAHVDGGRGAGAAPRRQGYRRAMARAGLGRFIDVIPGDFTERAGTEAATALSARRSLPSAVFAANDLVAVGLIDALERDGRQVPGDVSVVGYDNTFFARLRHVSLTTVDQPREEMGRCALSLLVERMDGRRKVPELVLTTPRLVARDTTAPPRR
jgi:DNA-binding LacI/PurR family transcriptional regulator